MPTHNMAAVSSLYSMDDEKATQMTAIASCNQAIVVEILEPNKTLPQTNVNRFCAMRLNKVQIT